MFPNSTLNMVDARYRDLNIDAWVHDRKDTQLGYQRQVPQKCGAFDRSKRVPVIHHRQAQSRRAAVAGFEKGNCRVQHSVTEEWHPQLV